jgi:nicotinate-nucleotide adenylyltransferase
MRVAIFGGTFNPVHWGHLFIAETAFDQFALDRVIWVPAAHPPHKSHALLEFADRWEMVQRAIDNRPAFVASDVEAQRPGKSYASATLNALKQQYCRAQWHWILGLDVFSSLPKWRGVTELAADCTWLVAPRQAAAEAAPNPVAEQSSIALPNGAGVAADLGRRSIVLQYHLLQMPRIGISSSMIRTHCQQGHSIRYLVPESVRSYITAKKLYQIS